MKQKKLIAFDMYKTCLDIEGEEKLFLLLSELLGIERRNIVDFFLTKNIPLEDAMKNLGIPQEHISELVTIYRSAEENVLKSVKLFPETMTTLSKLKKS